MKFRWETAWLSLVLLMASVAIGWAQSIQEQFRAP